MKSTEFRRENLVEYNGRYFRIDTIAEEFPTLDTAEFGIGVVGWNSIKPIQLTEKILLKCGFVYDGMYRIKGMSIWMCNDMFLCYKNGVIIQHLHQLQNLYFALTGEELKIEL